MLNKNLKRLIDLSLEIKNAFEIAIVTNNRTRLIQVRYDILKAFRSKELTQPQFYKLVLDHMKADIEVGKIHAPK